MSERGERRESIEDAIEKARDNVAGRIDEIDRRLRSQLDFKQIAGDHAPQVIATGAVLGFLLGYGIPKVLLRSVQIGVPLWLAIRVVKKRVDAAAEDDYPVEMM